MQFFRAKITVIAWANFGLASLKKEEEDEQFGSLATLRFSTLAKVSGNFGGLFGCRNPRKWRLGAYKSLDVIFWRDLESLILYCVYGVSVPSLHRESTDSLIQEQESLGFKVIMA